MFQGGVTAGQIPSKGRKGTVYPKYAKLQRLSWEIPRFLQWPIPPKLER